ncbi:hypothetical protein KL938_001997 [Ogataea parapolymorpha]|nr:hypothetical protein KL938_001997 [Ogataea parapolymorpha]
MVSKQQNAKNRKGNKLAQNPLLRAINGSRSNQQRGKESPLMNSLANTKGKPLKKNALAQALSLTQRSRSSRRTAPKSISTKANDKTLSKRIGHSPAQKRKLEEDKKLINRIQKLRSSK